MCSDLHPQFVARYELYYSVDTSANPDFAALQSHASLYCVGRRVGSQRWGSSRSGCFPPRLFSPFPLRLGGSTSHASLRPRRQYRTLSSPPLWRTSSKWPIHVNGLSRTCRTPIPKMGLRVHNVDLNVAAFTATLRHILSFHATLPIQPQRFLPALMCVM